MSNMMRALVKARPEPGIWMEQVPVPEIGPNDVLIKVKKTGICGTDVHILKGEYPVAKGLTVGHEPVGVIEKLGSEVKGYREGQRVIVIGKGGQTLKWIGQKSREELIELFDRPVHLFLHVKVDERWADKREFYGDVGLDFDA